MELFYPDIRWNVFQKIAFRFISLFVILFMLPLPESVFVPFFGNTLLGIKEVIDMSPSGSGDKLMNYVNLFMYSSVAVAGTLTWSILDRKRKNYDTAFHLFLITCRYYLAFALLGYGIFKVYHIQMPDIRLSHLLQPIGEQTPMGLAWRFVGFSPAYSTFSGLMEMIPGVLLLFRRTTIAGALVAFAVMLNVMVMNFTFDIPVKIYSSFLLLLSLIILSPGIIRLFHFLFTNQAIPARPAKPLFTKKPWRIVQIVAKCLFIIFTIYTLHSYYAFSEGPQSPLYGVYKASLFIKNNDTIPLYSDSSAWKNIVFGTPGSVAIFKFNERKCVFNCEVDTVAKKIKLSYESDPQRQFPFEYNQINDSIFTFEGIIDMDKFVFTGKKMRRKDFTLYKTGFNWVNEFPNNK
jgi:hypothetical protein